MHGDGYVEPWLRGTHAELPAVPRAVVHALEMAREDVVAATAVLSAEEWFARPSGVAHVAFHVRHIVGSVDRLLTYAAGAQLSAEQWEQLAQENSDRGDAAGILQEFASAMTAYPARVMALAAGGLERAVHVGRARIPATAGGGSWYMLRNTRHGMWGRW